MLQKQEFQAKIQDLLDNAVGYNNSKVQVSVKMDFSIDEESRESYEVASVILSVKIITEGRL